MAKAHCPKRKIKKHRIHWDHYFVQWCLHWLPTLGLEVEGKPQFSQLPLVADILVIVASLQGSWQAHPIWKLLNAYTVVEFKSVHDAFESVDFGKLMAYVGLTMEKEKLPPEVEIGGWLVVPYINRQLQKVLRLKHIRLQTLSPGIHQAHTGLFPLLVVEYNKLPNEAVFAEFKTFMKSGAELRQSMELALRKWMGSKLYEEYTTIITSIHTEEAHSVIQVLKEDKKKFKKMAGLMLEELGDEAETLPFIQQRDAQSELKGELKGKMKGKLETARQMKADGVPMVSIIKYTGLSEKEIQSL